MAPRMKGEVVYRVSTSRIVAAKLQFLRNQQSTQKILSPCSGFSRESGLYLQHVSCPPQPSVSLGRGGGKATSGAVAGVSPCRYTAKLLEKLIFNLHLKKICEKFGEVINPRSRLVQADCLWVFFCLF